MKRMSCRISGVEYSYHYQLGLLSLENTLGRPHCNLSVFKGGVIRKTEKDFLQGLAMVGQGITVLTKRVEIEIRYKEEVLPLVVKALE